MPDTTGRRGGEDKEVERGGGEEKLGEEDNEWRRGRNGERGREEKKEGMEKKERKGRKMERKRGGGEEKDLYRSNVILKQKSIHQSPHHTMNNLINLSHFSQTCFQNTITAM